MISRMAEKNDGEVEMDATQHVHVHDGQMHALNEMNLCVLLVLSLLLIRGWLLLGIYINEAHI